MKSRFNQYILIVAVLYIITMYRIFDTWQSIKDNFGSPEELMKLSTLAYGFIIGAAFILRAQKRKSEAGKARKKAIHLAQSGNYKNSRDISFVIDPEFRDASKLWSDDFRVEIDNICKVANPN